MTQLLVVPEAKVYPSLLSLKELCLMEPLTWVKGPENLYQLES